VTASSLATALGTLVLAVATFASVRSANRAARAAERSLLAGLRPVLVTSRFDDPPQKIGFADARWFRVDGGSALAEATDEAVYHGIPIRNVGSGIGVLHGWHLYPELNRTAEHAPLDGFVRLTRDLYIPPNDIGFWQGTYRDPSSAEFQAARAAIVAGDTLTVEILYGDHEGGQRTVSRFAITPRDDDGWIVGVSRHWNIDRPNPR
jgi:hypothetical protein